MALLQGPLQHIRKVQIGTLELLQIPKSVAFVPGELKIGKEPKKMFLKDCNFCLFSVSPTAMFFHKFNFRVLCSDENPNINLLPDDKSDFHCFGL